MNSSMDEVKEKEIAFLPGNFYNVRFSENYCFAVHKGDAGNLSDLIPQIRPRSFKQTIQGENCYSVITFMYEVTLT